MPFRSLIPWQLLLLGFAEAFPSFHRGRQPLSPFNIQFATTSSSSSTRLYYRDDTTQPPAAHVLTIPVLGAIPNQLPLLPGKELILAVPTPGQWTALEQALVMHQQQDNDTEVDSTASKSTIQAAPIIALMDDYTTTLESSSLRPGERYATIAAIVGVSSSNNHKHSLDFTDASSFMESLREIGRMGSSLEYVNVRLVGIGRAALHDFFYDIPAAKRQSVDEDGHLVLDRAEDDTNENDDGQRDAIPSSVNDNVIMAQFDILMDGLAKGGARKGKPTSYASPVHAIAEMSSLAGQVQHLHQERKRLVAGIRAAEARLRAVMEDEELVDHDGIGQLFANSAKQRAQQVLIDDFLHDFGEDSLEKSYFAQPELDTDSSQELSSKENYGMGYSAATFSTIRDLTSVWLEKLAPYFSAERQESEEHYYETLSFVAILAMDKFLEPKQLGWALQCCNTSERLQQGNTWMTEHLKLLKEKSLAVSKQLIDCGEECTDLW